MARPAVSEAYLVLMPLILLGVLMVGIAVRYSSKQAYYQAINEEIEVLTATCDCPDMVRYSNCTVTTAPVMGGVDVVKFFVDYQLPDGSYNESNSGTLGNSRYASVYGGYTFWFESYYNMRLFEQAPEKYLPQWGGFCSWGIAGEICPDKPWQRDCLGPSGNWDHWTIQQDRLFFFLFNTAKSLFMADPDLHIAQGDIRWNSWYSPDEFVFSTNCFINATSMGGSIKTPKQRNSTF